MYEVILGKVDKLMQLKVQDLKHHLEHQFEEKLHDHEQVFDRIKQNSKDAEARKNTEHAAIINRLKILEADSHN